MSAQGIPQAILDFIGQWLSACIKALFSPAEFGKAETETLPKLIGFAGSSATLAFILFGLVRPDFKIEENTNYLIFCVLLWCVISFIITAFIKICGGKQSPAANIAVCLHLTALFYLLQMVAAITVFYFMKNSGAAFRVSFIVLGGVLGLVYFPIILGTMNELSFKGKTAFTSLCTPLILVIAALDWQSSSSPSIPPPAAPRPPLEMLKPASSLLPPPATAPAQPASAEKIVFNPPPVGAEPPAAFVRKPPANPASGSASHNALTLPLSAPPPSAQAP